VNSTAHNVRMKKSCVGLFIGDWFRLERRTVCWPNIVIENDYEKRGMKKSVSRAYGNLGYRKQLPQPG
jgi:hypothetical protein